MPTSSTSRSSFTLPSSNSSSSSSFQPIYPGQTIGIVGGGQLGKMLAEAANRMGYRLVVLDPSPDAPAFSMAHESIVAGFDDEEEFKRLVEKSAVVTYEFENVNSNLIASLHKATGKIPQGHLPLYLAQNRAREKTSLKDAGLTVAPYYVLSNVEKEITKAITALGFPLVVKTQEGGYDGKGQVVLKSKSDLPQLKALYGIPCVAEQFLLFDYEASIIGTRSITDEFSTFPVAKNLHHNNILHQSVVSKGTINEGSKETSNDEVPLLIRERLHTMLKHYMETYDIRATLAMEVFIVGEEIYVNELAPRPHNSGHYTIEGCATSQFEQHIRAICGLPLGATTLTHTTVMYNLLGQHKTALIEYLPHLPKEAHLHLYGKQEWKDNRKMGHVTFLFDHQKEEQDAILKAFTAAIFAPISTP